MNIQQASATNTTKQEYPPGPKGLPVIGVAPQVLKDPLGFFESLFRQYGDTTYFRIGGKEFYIFGHPDHVQYVLQKNHRNYRKGPNYKKLKPVLGDGLVTSDGELWLRQRRLIQPAFHHKRLAELASVMIKAAESMLDRWQHFAKQGSPLDIADEFMRVTLDIVSRALFSTDTSGFADRISQNLPIILERTNERFFETVNLSWLPTSRNRRYQKALLELDAVVYEVIEKRRHSPERNDDLLTMLLEATDEETGERMTDRQLRDEVMTLYLAGHETTANALSWCTYLLAQNPHIVQKLQTEVDQVLQSRTPANEDLPFLRYTRMVIDETLRIYPSVWSFARTPLAVDEVDGYRIEPGVNVVLVPYITHQHPDFWDHPEKFDPERFSSERSAVRHPFAYFPFGGGPRLCIGNNFALMEATLILAMITQRFHLDLVANQTVDPQPVVTLRPRYGIQMLAHQR
jgi:cytochrome P450